MISTSSPRRRRHEGAVVAAPAVGCGCRSCAAATVADCVALGCCPCAVVGLLGLALVRAPLAVGRRLARRRRRKTRAVRGKPVRDVVVVDQPEGPEATAAAGSGDKGFAKAEEELAPWLEEMYRAGHWGFGRLDLQVPGSEENPVKAAGGLTTRPP
ncbi:hypothetical protein BRADI_2g16020v3 [Brachypodium distachyon]|uniref:Uncharacterized protein n=1 Tax=Brachypodium distachyon TaxID=15368 RepID=I1HG93_BRADI|nr:hypothetical protein BRADI_2g16020v3 [Brachypodium distachyon]